MNISCNTLLALANDRVQTNPADFANITKTIPGIDRLIEVDVAPIKILPSIDSKIVFRVL